METSSNNRLDINLLERQQKVISRRKQRAKIYTRKTLMVAGLASLLSLVIVGYRFWLMRSVGLLAEELEERNGYLESLQQVAEENVAVNQRLAAIETILKGRETFDEKINVFDKVYKSGSEIRGVSFGGDDKAHVMEIDGSIGPIGRFIDFNQSMVDMAQEGNHKYLELTNLTRSEEGLYQFDYSIDLLSEEGKSDG